MKYKQELWLLYRLLYRLLVMFSWIAVVMDSNYSYVIYVIVIYSYVIVIYACVYLSFVGHVSHCLLISH